MKFFLSALSLSFFLSNLAAQPAIEWQKMLGGSANEGTLYNDNLSSARQKSDGGFILAGYTSSNDGDVTGNHGGRDAWVVKLNSAGNLDWQKTYGGSGYDAVHAIRQTADGGYILGCLSTSLDGDILDGEESGEFWIVKLDEAGQIQWQSSLGGSNYEDLYAINQTSDGGYIAIGTTISQDGDVSGFDDYINIWVVKLDDFGAIQWGKVLGGSAQDTGMDVIETEDGGFILASFVSSNNLFVSGNHGGFDCWVVKLSAVGEIEWGKTYGGSKFEVATCIQQTSDGGYIIAGSAESTNGDVTDNNGGSDYWVVKLNASGAIEWQKTFGGSGADTAFAIQETSDGGYIVGGATKSNDGDVTNNHGEYDYWMVKINSIGELQWQKTLGGSKDDYADDLQQTNDGGYLISGISKSNDGDVSGNHGANSFDYWVVKLSPTVGVEDVPTIAQQGHLEISPNPATDKALLNIPSDETVFLVNISDAQGRPILQKTISNGSSLDVALLPNGVYSVIATTPSGKIFSNKLNIVK